eukprot:TRINITY_DN4748_c0_g1_i4.p1 TRINITY_DN4748_c0_g1~~TRINITY_DN4748_c0_g1_i4.p1  ORF type:complete len:136 (-),score=38.75 TRINITY_DN4748_c0_g1_i4:203-610(-)
MSANSREALRLYKSLHRTVQKVFREDRPAMFAARDKICEEFEKNRKVSNENAIAELINQGNDVNRILTEQVVQLKKVSQDKYHMKIRDETHMFENNPFREDVTDEEYRAANRSSRRRGGSCDEAKKDSDTKKPGC